MRIGFTIGILLLLCTFYLRWYYTSNAEGEVHLITNGYRGVVFIVFDSPKGANVSYEKGKRLYEIPLSGVLRTQFPKNDGWSTPSQYYYRSLGGRIPIKQAGIKISGSQVGSYSSSNGKQISYAKYIIGKPNELDSLYQSREKRNLDSLFLH